MKTTTIKITELVLDAGTQIRVTTDEATVTDYADAIRAGDVLPAVTVFYDGERHILADGFHRVLATAKAGAEEIECDVRQGGRVDAIKHALGCNTTHGLRRSNADKRRAVEIALEHFPSFSDRALATICAVSNNFVGDVRRQVSSDDTCPPSKRIGADGKQYPAPRQVSSDDTCPPSSPEAVGTATPDGGSTGASLTTNAAAAPVAGEAPAACDQCKRLAEQMDVAGDDIRYLAGRFAEEDCEPDVLVKAASDLVDIITILVERAAELKADGKALVALALGMKAAARAIEKNAGRPF